MREGFQCFEMLFFCVCLQFVINLLFYRIYQNLKEKFMDIDERNISEVAVQKELSKRQTAKCLFQNYESVLEEILKLEKCVITIEYTTSEFKN